MSLTRALCRIVGIAGFCLLGLASVSASAADFAYTYDAQGRLTRVASPNGETAVYTYDAAGNVVKVVRTAPTPFSVTGFSPVAGNVGATVTVVGAQFSTTPANNIVKFGTVVATVTTSTSEELVVTVPTGAVTAPISVTVNGVAVTSAASFTVGGSALPTVSSVTAAISASGALLTIAGTNFEPIDVNNTITFVGLGGSAVTSAANSATGTQITTTIPANVWSSQVKVTTRNGTSANSVDLYVPPTGYAVSDFVVRGRLSVSGAALTRTIAAEGKKGLMIFSGTTGQVLSLATSAMTLAGNTGLKVYQPNGALWQTYTSSGASSIFTMPALPAAGTYVVVVEPAATSTGNYTIDVAIAPDLIVTAVTVPTTAINPNADGSYTVAITYTVKNQGATPARDISSAVYVSTDTALDASDTFLAFTPRYTMPVAANGTYTVTETVTIPSSVAAGMYSILVVVDKESSSAAYFDGSIAETNEANNLRASTAKVILGPKP